MKKTVTTMGALLLLSATLAACNTDTDEPTSTNAANESQQQNEQPNETENNTTEQNSNEQQPEEQDEKTEDPKVEDQHPESATITYHSNGKSFTEDVITSKSNEMNYTISHLENFTLEAEDPGIDHLLYSKDDNLSMQIEVVTKEGVTFDDIKASASETMAAISSEIKELDLAVILENQAGILNIVGYETIFEETDKVTKVVFERENMFVTLTIYDTVAADLQDAFLQMGLSIH